MQAWNRELATWRRQLTWMFLTLRSPERIKLVGMIPVLAVRGKNISAATASDFLDMWPTVKLLQSRYLGFRGVHPSRSPRKRGFSRRPNYAAPHPKIPRTRSTYLSVLMSFF